VLFIKFRRRLSVFSGMFSGKFFLYTLTLFQVFKINTHITALGTPFGKECGFLFESADRTFNTAEQPAAVRADFSIKGHLSAAIFTVKTCFQNLF